MAKVCPSPSQAEELHRLSQSNHDQAIGFNLGCREESRQESQNQQQQQQQPGTSGSRHLQRGRGNSGNRHFPQGTRGGGRHTGDRVAGKHGGFAGQKRKAHYDPGSGRTSMTRPKRGRIVLPRHFLLGGNINDPLNLNALIEEQNQKSQEEPIPSQEEHVIPSTSTEEPPVPAVTAVVEAVSDIKESEDDSSKTDQPIEIIIPKNRRDPLNLFDEKGRQRRKRKRKRNNSLRLMLDEAQELSDRSKLLYHDGGGGSLSDSELQTTTPDTPEKLSLISPSFSIEATARKQQRTDSSPPPSKKRSHRDSIVSPVPIPGKPRFRTRSESRTTPIRRERDQKVEKKRDSAGEVHRRHRVPSEARSSSTGTGPKFNAKMARFRYGNYSKYYGYRLADLEEDTRFQCLKKHWFEGKSVLDIGCNIGHITLTIAKRFEPAKIVGIDIDPNLLGVARKNIRHYMDEMEAGKAEKNKYPPSFKHIYGPLSAPATQLEPCRFPKNVVFQQANYVLCDDNLLDAVQPEYDVILALSVTKWIHLNWGDAGLKRVFQRIFRNLHPGGCFIMEPQEIGSYKKRRKLTPEIWANYQAMQFHPDAFSDYLIKEVGFSSGEVVGKPYNKAKGFRRPVYIFWKPKENEKHEMAAENDNSKNDGAMTENTIAKEVKEKETESKVPKPSSEKGENNSDETIQKSTGNEIAKEENETDAEAKNRSITVKAEKIE